MNDTASVKVYFKLVLHQEADDECWTKERYEEYSALRMLYQRYKGKRTFEQFLMQVLGNEVG